MKHRSRAELRTFAVGLVLAGLVPAFGPALAACSSDNGTPGADGGPETGTDGSVSGSGDATTEPDASDARASEDSAAGDATAADAALDGGTTLEDGALADGSLDGGAEGGPAGDGASSDGSSSDGSTATGAAAISVGPYVTCAIVGGGAQCWGNNQSLQLPTPSLDAQDLIPVSMPGLTSGVTSISVGSDVACAVVNGAVECWGANAYGDLGNGTTAVGCGPSTFPCPSGYQLAPVVGLTSGAMAVSVGTRSACAITSAGGVECWGSNDSGELGNGSLTASEVPVPVTGLSSGVVAIAVGSSDACAITSAGALLCWGDNNTGQLGVGNYTDVNVPTPVTGLSSGVVSVSLSGLSSCAVLSSGAVECWGADVNGDSSYTDTPTATTGFSGTPTSVALGQFLACVTTAGGAVECWGSNSYGDLGSGNADASTVARTPVGVAGLGSGSTSVATNDANTVCAVVGRGVDCWGSNQLGQLGNDSTTDSDTPVAVQFNATLPYGVTVTPPDVFSTTDCAGDPVAAVTVTLQNVGGSNVAWTATATGGFGVSPMSGSLGHEQAINLSLTSPQPSGPPTVIEQASGQLSIVTTFTNDAGVPLDAGQTLDVPLVEGVNGCFITNAPPATESFDGVTVGQTATINIPDPSAYCGGSQGGSSSPELAGGGGRFSVVGETLNGSGGIEWTIQFAPQTTGMQSATFSFVFPSSPTLCGNPNLSFTATGTGM
jgi:alpha-tubulin suppressor-like RCC1 family protein